MHYIETTQTKIEKLKKLAKVRHKETGKPYVLELDNIAREWSYAHWKHVTECRKITYEEQQANQRQRELEQGFINEMPPEIKKVFDKQALEDQKFWLFQLYKETPEGKARFRPVHKTLDISWRGAEKV